MAYSDAKYPWPSTVNPANFISVKPCLHEEINNFLIWKKQMLCLLESQGLLGFINGEIQEPLPVEDESSNILKNEKDEQKLWRRTDRLVKGWILGSIGKDALGVVWELDTARKVWLELEKIFNQARCESECQSERSTSTAHGHEEDEIGIQLRSSLPPQDGDKQPPNTTRNYAVQKVLKEDLPLYIAILEANWEATKQILDADPQASKARINSSNQTALHVAILTNKPHHFVERLVEQIPVESIALKDDAGDSALSIAAAIGNTGAATILVNKMPNLLYIPNSMGNFPVQQAALFSHRDMLEYLISVTRDDLEMNPYAGIDGLRLLVYVIDVNFFDVAIRLVEKYPHVATLKLPDNTSALKRIAGKRSLFFSSNDFTFWERMLFYSFVKKMRLRRRSTMPNDIEMMAYDAHQGGGKNFCTLNIYPILREFKDQSSLILQALQLTTCLCKRLGYLSHKEASDIYLDAIQTALELGIDEVVEQVVAAFPDAIYCSTPWSEQSIIHMAIQNRSVEVFNLIYKMSGHKHLCLNRIDSDGNNLLHAAAKLAPPHKLEEISRIFQMQREIQWYKEVEKFVPTNYRDQPNKAGKTPKMVFTEEHKELKEEAEKWVKESANSCTIASALIAGAMFAGAITVPGGNDSNTGFPILFKEIAFTIYAITNAVSLLTSTTSLLMFMSILTSRYVEEEFLANLPKKLMVQLVNLFLSITCMMVSYGAAVYLVFGQKNVWVLPPLFALATFPALFVVSQFPLLVDFLIFTYGPGILGKKGDCVFS